MPTAVVDGIPTRYEVTGDGPPLLMFSPGGFDSTLESWRTVGIYKRLDLLAHLEQHYTCITFDRRESGHSAGGWSASRGRTTSGRASGCSTSWATPRHTDGRLRRVLGGGRDRRRPARPRPLDGAVLPAGGVKYRMKQHSRFEQHLAYVDEHGLGAVAALARESGATFTKDPRVGPWNSVLRTDESFAAAYAAGDPARYRVTVASSGGRSTGTRCPAPSPRTR